MSSFSLFPSCSIMLEVQVQAVMISASAPLPAIPCSFFCFFTVAVQWFGISIALSILMPESHSCMVMPNSEPISLQNQTHRNAELWFGKFEVSLCISIPEWCLPCPGWCDHGFKGFFQGWLLLGIFRPSGNQVLKIKPVQITFNTAVVSSELCKLLLFGGREWGFGFCGCLFFMIVLSPLLSGL